MSVQEAMEEAYAANPAGEIVAETLELDHPAFAGPIYVVVGGVTEDASLPLTNGGTPVLFTYCPAKVTRPGVTPDGPTPMKIAVQNVTRLLMPHLRDAKASNQPISITYRSYVMSDLSGPAEVLKGYFLGPVSITATVVEATVTLREIERQAFPLPVYDELYYPALTNS